MYNNAFRDQSVLVTGHTGFKGSWLSLYLNLLGAKVTGYALNPPTNPNIFDIAQVEAGLMASYIGDIRNFENLYTILAETRPQFIFHLAAQPLVLTSYKEPLETFDVNITGTLTLLEVVRKLDFPCTIIVVATDKVYANQEWLYGYRENDTLGGYDPYSASKAAMEIAVKSYRDSFFDKSSHICVATARAGNVIGGGDWASMRLVPDCIRSLQAGNPIELRYPQAIRPWQHVLEPLSGYLCLASQLSEDKSFAGAWNFGPTMQSVRTVSELVYAMESQWDDQPLTQRIASHIQHETQTLRLNIDKAQQKLGWQPIWDFDTTVRRTIKWYKTTLSQTDEARNLCIADIEEYHLDAQNKGLSWAT